MGLPHSRKWLKFGIFGPFSTQKVSNCVISCLDGVAFQIWARSVILCQSEWVLNRLISDEASGLDFLNEHLTHPEKNNN